MDKIKFKFILYDYIYVSQSLPPFWCSLFVYWYRYRFVDYCSLFRRYLTKGGHLDGFYSTLILHTRKPCNESHRELIHRKQSMIQQQQQKTHIVLWKNIGNPALN